MWRSQKFLWTSIRREFLTIFCTTVWGLASNFQPHTFSDLCILKYLEDLGSNSFLVLNNDTIRGPGMTLTLSPLSHTGLRLESDAFMFLKAVDTTSLWDVRYSNVSCKENTWEYKEVRDNLSKKSDLINILGNWSFLKGKVTLNILSSIFLSKDSSFLMPMKEKCNSEWLEYQTFNPPRSKSHSGNHWLVYSSLTVFNYSLTYFNFMFNCFFSQ